LEGTSKTGITRVRDEGIDTRNPLTGMVLICFHDSKRHQTAMFEKRGGRHITGSTKQQKREKEAHFQDKA